MSTIIRCGAILTARTDHEILFDVALLIEEGMIVRIVPDAALDRSAGGEILDARDRVIIPGFVQTHLHLCQTLFRGLADDLQLLDWLQEKIFPFEAAHSERSLHSSAMVGIAELVRSGTTSILDMGTIHHQEEIIRAVGESGMRGVVGKAMMDLNDAFPALRESTADSLTSTRKLAEQWHNSYEGRVRYAAAPRFVLSCSDNLLREVGEMVISTEGMLLHTHASENLMEVSEVRKRCGMENIEFLRKMNLLSEKSSLAHCIHLTNSEVEILAQTHTNITHCPSSNLKLGSGIAQVPRLLDRGINVSLGADGASCNNTLNMFQEMRLASLLQKPVHGATAMAAERVFGMATRCGAEALGLGQSIGTIEPGKCADLVVLDLNRTWNPILSQNLHAAVVYSASPENVESVMIDGKWIYRNRSFQTMDEERILAEARIELQQLLGRV